MNGQGMTWKWLSVFSRAVFLFLAASAMLLSGSAAQTQDAYQKPPEAVRKVLNAPVTSHASVGRARDTVLLYEPVLYPPIAELAFVVRKNSLVYLLDRATGTILAEVPKAAFCFEREYQVSLPNRGSTTLGPMG